MCDIHFSKPREKNPMHADLFEVRLARVRHHFATTLESKIMDTVVSTDHMAENDNRVLEYVSESYRRLHNICGIGPTVGFTATGEAAHAAKAALVQPYLEKRRPTETEALSLKRALAK